MFSQALKSVALNLLAEALENDPAIIHEVKNFIQFWEGKVSASSGPAANAEGAMAMKPGSEAVDIKVLQSSDPNPALMPAPAPEPTRPAAPTTVVPQTTNALASTNTNQGPPAHPWNFDER
jgi:hypothetical protein